MPSAASSTSTKRVKDEREIATILNSIQTRLDSLANLSYQFSASATLEYKWPGNAGGDHLEQKWLFINWQELHVEFDDNVPLTGKGLDPDGLVDISGPVEVCIRSLDGAQEKRYISRKFKDFIIREWNKAKSRSIRRGEAITCRKKVPEGRDDSTDDEWQSSKSVKKRSRARESS